MNVRIFHPQSLGIDAAAYGYGVFGGSTGDSWTPAGNVMWDRVLRDLSIGTDPFAPFMLAHEVPAMDTPDRAAKYIDKYAGIVQALKQITTRPVGLYNTWHLGRPQDDLLAGMQYQAMQDAEWLFPAVYGDLESAVIVGKVSTTLDCAMNKWGVLRPITLVVNPYSREGDLTSEHDPARFKQQIELAANTGGAWYPERRITDIGFWHSMTSGDDRRDAVLRLAEIAKGVCQ